MKLEYTAPQAEVVEISLNDSIAAGCNTLVRRRENGLTPDLYGYDFSTKQMKPIVFGDGAYSYASLYTFFTQNIGDAKLDADESTVDSWSSGACFTS